MPADTNFEIDHPPSQRHLDCHLARARGGAGAIIFESVHSPNRRDDEFGGTIENRLRFPVQAALPSELGADFCLGIRGDESSGGELGADEVERLVPMLATAQGLGGRLP